MDITGDFNGFDKKTLTFLKNLKKNNDRDWFKANRTDYTQYFVEPAQQFVLALGPKLTKLSPAVAFDPNHTGRGSIKKIHLDQRFVKDRPPFKTWLDIIFWEGPFKAKKDNVLYFMRLEPNKLVLGSGIRSFNSEVMKAYREAVDTEKTGAELSRILTGLLKNDDYCLGNQHYKQVPRGFAPDHKRAELLKNDGIHVWFETKVPKEAFSADLVDYAFDHYKRLAPLQHWCVKLLNGMK